MKRFLVAALCVLAVGAPRLKAEAAGGEGMALAPDSFLFVDHKPRAEGDLVTVIVMESAQASKKTSKKTSKKAGTSVDLSATGINEKAKFGTDSKYDGGTSTERRGTLVARITAQVVDVLPNGNLVIDGRQNIVISGEKQTITVSGIVRPRDIDADNAVMSSSIADARIEYTGKEPRSNWLHWLGPVGWVLNWLF